MQDNQFKFTAQTVLLPFISVLVLWIAFWAEIRLPGNFGEYGILPRDVTGLRGIIFSPFLHGSAEHLYNNSLPLLVLLAALSYFYHDRALKVLLLGILFSGLGTWLIGRENYHIGASGVVYVLASFIFFKGIMTKYYRLVALSLFVVMFYGSMIWYVFPDIEQGISWEAHLCGFLTGFGLAVRIRTPEYKKVIRYDWERPDYDPAQDKFMQRFDENGNFVNPPKPEETDQEPVQPEIVYDFVPTRTRLEGPSPDSSENPERD